MIPTMNRFWSKVSVLGEDDCWLWQAAIGTGGYGAFKLNGEVLGSHVVAVLLTNGPLPDGHEVMHSCDNRACVNPKHLSSGTRLQNVQDMDKKGRRGNANGMKARHAKLMEAQVVEIRSRRGENGYAVAKEYGVSNSTIYRIWTGESWSHC